MTEDKVRQLVIEETRKAFPELENNMPSYFEGIVQQATNTIVNDYAIDTLGSEEHVSSLIAIDLASFKEALN
ncbi:hypothetical protein [Priestia megaterium]|uniref:hypothetical protein n=1 Tax=Priestia megaterium TaxID=1404 RepID=UPI00203CCE1F|nr:hypothetical protein [Priestia megaterium]MCM3196284.1 hypothetical protein [Priestia megaterium]